MGRRLGIIGAVIGIGAAYYFSTATNDTPQERDLRSATDIVASPSTGKPAADGSQPPKSTGAAFEQRASVAPPPSATVPSTDKASPVPNTVATANRPDAAKSSNPMPAAPVDARAMAPAGDKAGRSLTASIQAELKRAGCYDGEIDGVWNPASRRGMKTFTERVNATLPTEKPDFVLLSLLQTRDNVTCKSCPAGQVVGQNGKCSPAGMTAAHDGKPASAPRPQGPDAAARAAAERQRLEAEQKARNAAREEARRKAELARIQAIEARKRDLAAAEEKRARLAAERDAQIAAERAARFAAEAAARKTAELQRRREMAAAEAQRIPNAANKSAALDPRRRQNDTAQRTAMLPPARNVKEATAAMVPAAPVARPAPVEAPTPIARPQSQETRTVAVVRLMPATSERSALGMTSASAPPATSVTVGSIEPTSAHQPRFVGFFVPPATTAIASPAPRARPASVHRPAPTTASVNVQRLTYREALYGRIARDSP